MPFVQTTRVIRRRGMRGLGNEVCSVTPNGARVCYDSSKGVPIVDPAALATQAQIPTLGPFETLATSATIDPTTGQPVYGVYPVINNPALQAAQQAAAVQSAAILEAQAAGASGTPTTSLSSTLSSFLPAGFSLTSPSTWPSWMYYLLAAGALYFFFAEKSPSSRRRR